MWALVDRIVDGSKRSYWLNLALVGAEVASSITKVWAYEDRLELPQDIFCAAVRKKDVEKYNFKW